MIPLSPAMLPHRLRDSLLLLRRAYECAHSFCHDPWDFAVEWRTLQVLGLTSTDVRCLACQGVIEHAVETPMTKGGGRSFRRVDPMVVTERTALVLTAAGVALLSAHPAFQDDAPPVTGGALHNGPNPEGGTATPVWDRETRELSAAGRLVKRFRVPAPNQELILEAFQEEGWPPRMDNPLPPGPTADVRERLHDTIKNLNRHQVHRLLLFQGDGRGLGVRWRPRG